MSAPSSLDEAFASPAAKRQYNRSMFRTIAPRYDLITRLFSYGSDQRWKRQLMGLLSVAKGWTVLDLACGTGDLAFASADHGASVVALDITPRMVELAKEKSAARGGAVGGGRAPAWVVGDMGVLPVASGRFDAITTGYGLRNVPDLQRAIAEMYRVLRPGGVIGSLDFDHPEQPIVRAVYLRYLDIVGAVVGWILHREPDTYRYIPASIRRYPGAARVADMLRSAGFVDVRVVAVLGGLMAIHVGRKPASSIMRP